MNKRIKELRKTLGLSQDEFGRRLGVTRGAITNIEFNKTEPKPLFIDLLCREFNVSERWLRTGVGEMFVQLSRDEEIAAFVGSVLAGEEDNFKRRFIAMLSKLNESDWELLEKMVDIIKKD